MFTFRLLRNIFSNYARLAISGLIGFLLTPILFHSLQPENYAILVFGLGTVVALQGLELGLYATVERFVSDLAARGQHAELRRLVSSAFYLQAGLGVLGAIALLLLSSFLARFFHVEGTAAASGRVVLIWLGLSLVFQLPGNTLRAFLEGCQDFHLANAVDVLVQLLRASFIIVLLWKGFGLGTIAVVFPAAALAQLVAMLFSLRWATLRFWPNPADVDLNSLRSVSRFAGLTFVSENAGWYFSQLDIFLAARLLPLPNLAILAVARRFPWALTQLCLQPLHAAYPLLPAAEARGERSLTQKFFYLATRNLLALALPIAVALFAWSELILRLWVGEEVLAGVPIFRIFLVFAIFAALLEIPITLLFGIGKIRFCVVVSVGMLATGVGLGAWACSRYGLVGLAVSYTVVQTVGTLLLFGQSLQVAQIPVRHWLRKAVAPAIGAALPTVLWFWASTHLVPHNLVGLIVSVAIGFVLFLALFAGQVGGLRKQSWQMRARRLLTEID